MEEMIPRHGIEMNTKMKTNKSTYYFALSCGNRVKNVEKARESFKEPRKVSESCQGFDHGLV